MFHRILATVAVASMAIFSVAFAASQFSDVPADHWAADSISWANEMGLMTGPANMPGMFDPAGNVNRAQLAAVLYRYNEMMMEKLGMEDDVEIDGPCTLELIHPLQMNLTDENGDPITGATVTIPSSSFSSHDEPFSVRTSGSYYHYGDPGVVYTYVVEHPDYETETGTISFSMDGDGMCAKPQGGYVELTLTMKDKLELGDDTERKFCTLELGAGLTLELTDELNGNPLTGATITSSPGGGGILGGSFIESASNPGTYSGIYGGEGTYTYTIEHPDYKTYEGEVVVEQTGAPCYKTQTTFVELSLQMK